MRDDVHLRQVNSNKYTQIIFAILSKFLIAPQNISIVRYIRNVTTCSDTKSQIRLVCFETNRSKDHPLDRHYERKNFIWMKKMMISKK